MRKEFPSKLLGTVALSFVMAIGTTAEGAPASAENKGKEIQSGSTKTWTYDRLQEAHPRSLPKPSLPYEKQQRTIVPDMREKEQQKFEPGKAPTLNLPEKHSLYEQPSPGESLKNRDVKRVENSRNNDLVHKVATANGNKSRPTAKSGSRKTGQGKAVTNQAGTENAHFTSSRVIPDGARTVYPYKAIGKLFYHDPHTNRDYTCSAAVIRPRLILTAGHCVHAGTGADNGYFTEFRFVPAFERGPDPEPFLAWKSRFVVTTPAWAAGKGEVPNAADIAIVELEDQLVSGGIHKIGEVTGTLGTKTRALMPNHTTKLGYPSNLDDGGKLHLVHSQHHRPRDPNNVEYGSDMGPGSSGGPWVENFGIPAVGQTGVFNVIVGVTSYGYDRPEPMVQGSSQLDDAFLKILEIACKHQSGNCE